MFARLFGLPLVFLAVSVVLAQPSPRALLVAQATSLRWADTALDFSVTERTVALLDALLGGNRSPLAEAVPEHRVARTLSDFNRYLNAVTEGIGPIQRYRLLGVHVHDRQATVVLAEVQGPRGTDVLRFVWRDGAMVLLNRGTAPSRG